MIPSGAIVSNANHKKKPAHDEVERNMPAPRLSDDSQAFIGLKLRELYDDVVAEPVPDRLLQLLERLGDEDTKASK